MQSSHPSETELARASLRAIAAFAARNAMRIHPILQHHYGEHSGVIHTLISAVRATAEARPFDLIEAGASQRAVKSLDRTSRDINALSAADCIGYAASCAASCLDRERGEAVTWAIKSGEAAAACAHFSTFGLAPEIESGAISAIRRDFDTAAAIAPEDADEMGGPVDLSEEGPFGPLWVSGPHGWFIPSRRPARK